MRRTANAWTSSQKDRLFPYGFDFIADKPLEPQRMSAPTLLRQALATFALARYYEYTGAADLQAPARRSAAHVRRAFASHP